jgi:hypothetical protein
MVVVVIIVMMMVVVIVIVVMMVVVVIVMVVMMMVVVELGDLYALVLRRRLGPGGGIERREDGRGIGHRLQQLGH